MLLVARAADEVLRAGRLHVRAVGERPELLGPLGEVLPLDAVHDLRVVALAPLQPKRLANWKPNDRRGSTYVSPVRSKCARRRPGVTVSRPRRAWSCT